MGRVPFLDSLTSVHEGLGTPMRGLQKTHVGFLSPALISCKE